VEAKAVSEPEIEKNPAIIKLDLDKSRDTDFERQNFSAEINSGQRVDEEVQVESPMAGRMTGTMEELERIQESLFVMSDEVKECIQDCLDCFKTCTETSVRCLKIGGKHAENEHINLMLDCSKICNLNADFMLRNSSYYPQTCGITADICDECADICDRFEDDFMKECASVCRRCAESCREMAR